MIIVYGVKKMKTKIILTISIIAILVIFIAGCTTNNSNVQKVAPNGETKTIPISFISGDWKYSPDTIIVKAGTKIRFEGDPKTLVGGMDTLIVDGYGVSKQIKEGDNVLEFVADTPGEFTIHCQNQMGNGKLIVEQ